MASNKRVLVPLAEGFEEIEAITIVDVLRRAEIDVVVAGLSGMTVTGSHAVRVSVDTDLGQVRASEFDAVVLPGGMPGAKNLRESQQVLELLRQFAEEGKIVAAICAGPTALEAAGLLRGRRATSYPGHPLPSAHYSEERVVVDGNVITSRGPGTAFDFALKLVEELVGSESARKHREKLLLAS